MPGRTLISMKKCARLFCKNLKMLFSLDHLNDIAQPGPSAYVVKHMKTFHDT